MLNLYEEFKDDLVFSSQEQSQISIEIQPLESQPSNFVKPLILPLENVVEKTHNTHRDNKLPTESSIAFDA